MESKGSQQDIDHATYWVSIGLYKWRISAICLIGIVRKIIRWYLLETWNIPFNCFRITNYFPPHIFLPQFKEWKKIFCLRVCIESVTQNDSMTGLWRSHNNAESKRPSEINSKRISAVFPWYALNFILSPFEFSDLKVSEWVYLVRNVVLGFGWDGWRRKGDLLYLFDACIGLGKWV